MRRDLSNFAECILFTFVVLVFNIALIKVFIFSILILVFFFFGFASGVKSGTRYSLLSGF